MKFSFLMALGLASFSALANAELDARNICNQVAHDYKHVVHVDSFTVPSSNEKAQCVITTQATNSINKESVITSFMSFIDVDFKDKNNPVVTVTKTQSSN